MLRSPNKLEVTFYYELLAPLLFFALSQPDETRQRRLLTRRFKRDVARYGYMLTESGAVMVKVEPDILEREFDASRRALVFEDMQILDRLTAKSK